MLTQPPEDHRKFCRWRIPVGEAGLEEPPEEHQLLLTERCRLGNVQTPILKFSRRWCRWSSCSLPRSQETPEATTPRELAGKKGRIQVERISPPWFRRSQGRVQQRKLTGGSCRPLSHREIPSGAVGKEIKFLLPPDHKISPDGNRGSSRKLKTVQSLS